MEQNPLEQQKNKIEIAKKKMRDNLDFLFDKKEEFNSKIKEFISQLDLFQKAGLSFNKDQIVQGLKESANIKDKETFITHLLKTIEPIIVLQVAQPKIFEEIRREITVNNSGGIKLSEILYVHLEKSRAFIHLAPATELIKEDGIANFKKEIEEGLKKLAEMINSDEKIKEIWAVSWIVAKNPLLLERLGFTLKGEISKEELGEHFNNDERSVAKASIKREDFLARYLK